MANSRKMRAPYKVWHIFCRMEYKMAADDYAVVVGIASYPGISNLQGPENDARNFYAWLVAADGGAVPQHQAELICSSRYPVFSKRPEAKPIIEDINTAFELLIEQGMNNHGRTGRRLYIFMAGHGFSPSLEESALLMANAGQLFMGYHIPGHTYAQWFVASALFDEVVLFMDCCRDSYLNVPRYVPPWSPVPSNDASTVKKFYGLATKWSHNSREQIIDGQMQGLFTWSLLKALRGDAPDEQGRVTGEVLSGVVSRMLKSQVPSNDYQEPAFEGDDDLVLAAGFPCPLTTVQITFAQLGQGTLVTLCDCTLNPVDQHMSQNGPWEVQLKPGFYQLSVPNIHQGLIFEVSGKDVLSLHGQSQCVQIRVKDGVANAR